MTPEMQIAVIASGSALFGSIIGGAVSYFTTIESTKISWRYTQLDKQIETLAKLHGDFIAEASRVVLLAIDKKFDGATDFTELNSLLARIRILSDESTVSAAIDAAKSAIKQHKTEKEANAKEEFGTLVKTMCECSRKELQKLRKGA